MAYTLGETIPRLIQRLKCLDDATAVAEFIKEVPLNTHHDEIAAAWKAHYPDKGEDFLGVISALEQKKKISDQQFRDLIGSK